CLEKEPARRYQSVSQLGEDVRRFLAGEPVTARGGGTIYVLRRLAGKHRAIVAVAMSFLVLVMVSAVTSSVLYRNERRALARADEERRQADLARDAALKDRRQAVLEAERATAVEAFLRGVLSGADPRRMGKDITVAELLDRASQSDAYFKALEGKPLVEAAVRQAMGETYYGLGMNDRAAAEFRRALALETGEESASGLSEDAIHTMHSLATVLYSLGDFGEAQEIVEQAMSAMGVDEESPIRDEPTAELISLHSIILSAQGKFDHLIDNAGRRLDYYRRLYGAGDWRTLYAMNDLSYAYDCNQRYQDAVDMCREALESCRSAKGPDDPLTLTIRMNLAIALGKLNRTDEVESIVRDVLEARRRTLPPDHPVLADTLVEWAKICVSRKDTDGACDAIEEALGIQVRALGADHPKIAGTRVQLASLYVHQQRYDEADMQLMIAFDYLRDHACEQPDVVDGLKALALKTHQGHGTRADLAAWKTRLQALNCESQAP
ncbi:MAG: tetratricopeptide repeat protein, partial [Phycisphaerales bacterium]|nr:tetratricopeptide repeat protein [Phycisphaerales bacterium]